MQKTPGEQATHTSQHSSEDTADSHAQQFIARWQGVALTAATELSTSQTFVLELCALLGVPTPLPNDALDYVFERPITFAHGDGSTSAGRIDCYRRGHFVWESKKLRYVNAGGAAFNSAMLTARSQAENYARALPASEIAAGRPPFVLVADVGNVIEVYAEFTRSGASYTPFPDPRSHRIALGDLRSPAIRERLRLIWTDPLALDPARLSARITREVAAQLAELAKSLEQSGHRADHVAAFLTRSLFSMFAEDVELLPKGSFLKLLQSHREQPATLQQMLRILWTDMDHGGFSAALAVQVLKFNGKLFKQPNNDGYSLLLNPEQIDRLILAARSNWREVEPAIFGTLLERALDPTERHALGAHYTPRAYVERLVLPTVVEPLRADWANAQAAAVLLAAEAAGLSGKAHHQKMDEARGEIRTFHHQLCTLRVLDPACGSGNFLYVTLEHLKRLEGEVMNQLEAMGETQSMLGLEGETVTPQQLLGIEINERAAALAELVLWIGYLQWHIRTRGNKAVAEPVVHDYGNIEHRDAVLAWSDTDLAHDADGQLLSRWDGKTFKTHPVTGALVPDEAALVPQWQYIRPAQAKWPKADFIVGNPPFIGNKRMREALGDGYVEALRKVWVDVPDTADFVVYWWARAAAMVQEGKTRRMGLITTNSLTMVFNRSVVQSYLGSGLVLTYAIPDHPWVDNANGAAVRIAMTVVAKKGNGRLQQVIDEKVGEFGEVDVVLTEVVGRIHADLTIGANVTAAGKLLANGGVSFMGMIPLGAGFWVTKDEAINLGYGSNSALTPHVKRYLNGKDLMGKSREILALDFFGLTSVELMQRFPAAYQWLKERVQPQRDQDNRETRRKNWWLYGESVPKFRVAVKGLRRYIGTAETSKHRVFSFIEGDIFPDQKIRVVVHDSALVLGVLSSQIHVKWSLKAGGTLEDRPVYNTSRCFETFPFPDEDTGLTPELRDRIAQLAEQIDAHRKRQQAAHPGLTLTGMYNVLEILRQAQDGPSIPQGEQVGAQNERGGAQHQRDEAQQEQGRAPVVRVLTAKEKTIHTQGLVGVLKELHDELDAAVLQAYGLACGLTTDALLTHLVALNAQRAAEEKAGRIRWLRPEFQNPQAAAPDHSLSNKELPAQVLPGLQADLALNVPPPAAKAAAGLPAWPGTLPEQVRAVAQVLSTATAALPLAALEASFKGKGPWKKGLPRILETLEALGRARRVEAAAGVLWQA
ncbi:DNA methyltransferase [Polaromonas sp.]|jgi:hypothetical protein|uniref:class I SAM-dependent DNA methyltransferase n=1 Tax=Polaromonas sp. TaxID=1869339 RepID=UPI002C10687D|nr:DNA methyltransferase [Polaromonas sp.]HQS30303.1 class I SAM-dependent DNA methyltransferase [Polaromonas sp.]HQS89666.1 class I SAM-dependent DNA methyltransferase [Polaromonas sp.]